MGFNLRQVVPWGRSYEEYVAMFALSKQELGKNILGCGDGPASFNSILTKVNGRVTSIDPMYQLSRDEIRDCIKAAYGEVMEQTRQNQDNFVWNSISSLEELGRIRMNAMQTFLADYPIGKKEGRYLPISLPHLPYSDQQFDLALCSHLLFLYSPHLSAEFHLASIRAMCRVANEVRLFPLLELDATQSRYLDLVSSQLETEGYQITVVKVDYEFQRGGNQMMKITGPLRVFDK